MTTFSIIGGLIPTAIGIGAGSAQRSAIASRSSADKVFACC